jgi:hypothetical protein
MGRILTACAAIATVLGIAIVRPAAQSGSAPWPGPEGGRVQFETPNPSLLAGSQVAEITGRDLGGNPVSFKYGTKAIPTVVYFPCGFKPQEIDFATVVAQKRDRFNFVVVAWDRGTTEANAWVDRYVADMKPSWGGAAVDLVLASKTTVENLSLGGCPRTYVVSPEGKMLQNWAGEWGGATRAQVEQFFGVRLPARDSWNGGAPPK